MVGAIISDDALLFRDKFQKKIIQILNLCMLKGGD